MKQVKCEMCGSTDMMKQNGVFVCQSCGMKYSVEDAKKMMIEGVVEVTGTVGVDKTNDLQNWLTLARRAKSSEDISNAYKYYSLIKEQEPTNWEEWFFSQYYRLYTDRSNSGQFANEVNLILQAMWTQVKKQDHENTIREIITYLYDLSELCENDEKNYDFALGVFHLLANTMETLHKQKENNSELIIKLSLNTLKVASYFAEISINGDGFEIKDSNLIDNKLKKKWTNTENQIIYLIDYLISNKIEPHGFGSAYFDCFYQEDVDQEDICNRYYHKYGESPKRIYDGSPIYKGQIVWVGSIVVFENIKHCLEHLNNTCEPLSFREEKETRYAITDVYNEEYSNYVNKAKRFKPDFEFPNYYQQHPLPKTDGETLKHLKKELKDLNENYKKNFKLKEMTLSSYFLYSPEQAYSLRYDNIKKQLDKYNENYESEYNYLLKQAKKFDSQFTFPNLVKTNPFKVEQFLERPDFVQSAIDEIKYAWKREGSFGFIGLLGMSVFSCLIALFLGCAGGNDKDGTWIYLSLILAIGCGLFFRFVFKDLFGHKGITLFALLSGIIAIVLWNVVFLSAPDMNNGMMYIVLLVYAICL